MKLASLKEGRDGRLVVVSRDLQQACHAEGIAPTLQAALDHWDECERALRALYQRLNRGECNMAFAFAPGSCAAPLPRAYQWADGSAYVSHIELVRKARGADMPPAFWTDPLMYQGMSDGFLGPCDDIALANESWGIDFEGEVAVITGDVPMGITAEQAHPHIRLLMLVNDVSLRNLIPAELAKGFGFFQSKPATACSPVAVTPDELGTYWHHGRVHHRLRVLLNHQLFGEPEAGVDMTFGFDQLIAHASLSRRLGAGTIIGSGTVSNRDEHSGACCIAERRTRELLNTGAASTPFMRFGDRVRMEMFDEQGQSIFGAIDQQLVPYRGPAT
ncbi:fumarylacetoacetate hydrolase family protein [Oceanimonas baumannii]|uniref:2-keto-4-pentenoate hydratase n=1 Tax=Oceanimonas baumannii TaxID=129578 RepID=A0A235CLR6_9GAMM|nr:fumarylacetoacetate hydrolase family protein [Oceanimonas baumannii]OYD25379.1 2-keto-4-pentenoate hydratase [Oceanimonas baumannii]TDW61429.1 fumarylacetoacetate (FAA) hydrolase [Oceanimonas baumannii]